MKNNVKCFYDVFKARSGVKSEKIIKQKIWEFLCVKCSLCFLDYEIISTVILVVMLMQEGYISITGESMHLKYWAQLFKASLA